MKKRCSVEMEELQWFWDVQVTCYLYLPVFCFKDFFLCNKDRCHLCVCLCVYVCACLFFFHTAALSPKPLWWSPADVPDQAHTERCDLAVWPDKKGNIQTWLGKYWEEKQEEHVAKGEGGKREKKAKSENNKEEEED